MNLSTFLALRNPALSFLNFLSSQALLSYKPFSYKQKRVSFKRDETLQSGMEAQFYRACAIYSMVFQKYRMGEGMYIIIHVFFL